MSRMQSTTEEPMGQRANAASDAGRTRDRHGQRERGGFASTVPSRAACWVSAAVLAVYLVVMNFGAGVIAELAGYRGSTGMLFGLSMSPGYGPVRAHRILLALGARGRLADALTLAVFDVGFPLVYGLVLSRGLRRLGGRLAISDRNRRRLGWIPLVAMAANWLADACVFAMIGAFPRDLAVVALAASVLTALKFAVIGLSVVGLVVGLVVVGIRRRRPRIAGVAAG